MEYLPYTYLIGWSSLNKYYYGVEYGKKKKTANPTNLWTVYFTSSRVVKHFRDTYGEPDVVQVRRAFNVGSDETRMESAINWEKKVLTRISISDIRWLNGRIGGDICPEANKRVNMARYGVENVFQSEEIKTKIHETNIQKWGVSHPSYSQELLDRKAANNLAKYGCVCPIHTPESRAKTKQSMIERYGAPTVLQSPELKAQISATLFARHGVTNPGQMESVKAAVKEKRAVLSTRPVVIAIRHYTKQFKIKLGSGWYQRDTTSLEATLQNLVIEYGLIDHTT